MKLIVGLGNPDKRYKKTRHNVGFMVVEAMLKRMGETPHVVKKYKSLVFYKQSKNVLLAMPQTMMNNSGISVSTIVNQYKINRSDLWVIHDDLDLPIGAHKIQLGKGPKDHGGLKSIYEKLGEKDFWHVRIGIENRERVSKVSGEDYVLMPFEGKEVEVFGNVKNKIIEDMETQVLDLRDA